MSEPVSDHIEAAAAAIAAHERPDQHHCGSPDCCGQARYTCWAHSVAEAAVAALELFVDRRRINPQTRPKPCDNCGHLKGVHGNPCRIADFRGGDCGCPEHVYTPPTTEWESRLVGPWRKEEQ